MVFSNEPNALQYFISIYFVNFKFQIFRHIDAVIFVQILFIALHNYAD